MLTALFDDSKKVVAKIQLHSLDHIDTKAIQALVEQTSKF